MIVSMVVMGWRVMGDGDMGTGDSKGYGDLSGRGNIRRQKVCTYCAFVYTPIRLDIKRFDLFRQVFFFFDVIKLLHVSNLVLKLV